MADPITTRIEGTTPVESVIARHTAARVGWVAVPLVAVFWLTRGFPGAVGSAIGVAVVVGNLLLAGAILSVAIRISLAMYHAAALFGFFLRLGLVMVTMFAIVKLVDIDRPAFGISAVVSYMVLLTLEAVAVARGRERDLDWSR